MKYERRGYDEPHKTAIVTKGTKLAMVEGSSLDDYIRDWIVECGIDSGTPVVIMPVEQYEKLRIAYLMRGIA